MRKLVLTLCFLLAAFAVKAGRINGIRIESANEPIVVFVDGEQICTPTSTCFIAGITGSHQIEVYSARNANRGDRRGERIYNERIYSDGFEIKNIFIDNRLPSRPGNHNRPERPSYHDGVMDRGTFERFLKAVRDANFDSDRTKLIETSLITSNFTSNQCKRLAELYTFDSDKKKMIKMIFPRVIDKQNFFEVVEVLTFMSDKEEVNNFIRGYHD